MDVILLPGCRLGPLSPDSSGCLPRPINGSFSLGDSCCHGDRLAGLAAGRAVTLANTPCGDVRPLKPLLTFPSISGELEQVRLDVQGEQPAKPTDQRHYRGLLIGPGSGDMTPGPPGTDALPRSLPRMRGGMSSISSPTAQVCTADGRDATAPATSDAESLTLAHLWVLPVVTCLLVQASLPTSETHLRTHLRTPHAASMEE